MTTKDPDQLFVFLLSYQPMIRWPSNNVIASSHPSQTLSWLLSH
jgi:hypothetical protein